MRLVKTLRRAAIAFAAVALLVPGTPAILGSLLLGKAQAQTADTKAKTPPATSTKTKATKPVASVKSAPTKANPPKATAATPAKVPSTAPAKAASAPKPAATKVPTAKKTASSKPTTIAKTTTPAAAPSEKPASTPAPATNTAGKPPVQETPTKDAAKPSSKAPSFPLVEAPATLPSTTTLAYSDEGALEAADDSRRVLQVRKGDTLMDLLVGVGISRAEAHEAVSALRQVYDPRDLKPGQEITLTFAPSASDRESSLMGAAFDARADRTVSVTRRDDGRFAALGLDKILSRDITLVKGTIKSSLYEAAAEQGVPAAILAELISAFSYDVDFQRDLQPGDSFELLYERFHDDSGRVARDGALLFGGLLLSDVGHRVYRYAPRGEGPEYFDERGESVRKALLRTPIDGAKLTSHFGNRRHPVLGYSAMHRGVDFGAIEGTPIQAAGAGTVEQVGPNGNYGRYIRIRHNPEFATAYAHLSRFAGDLRVGKRIKQGEIIGYVGSTGLATGPHLHYEVIRRGGQVNPLSVKFPTGFALRGPELQRFVQSRIDIDVKIAGLASDMRVVENSRVTPEKPVRAAAGDKPAAKRKPG